MQWEWGPSRNPLPAQIFDKEVARAGGGGVVVVGGGGCYNHLYCTKLVPHFRYTNHHQSIHQFVTQRVRKQPYS